MLFMVVERFAPGLDVCFQLMECEDPVLFQEWAARWGELADIEIVPVVTSQATAAMMARLAEEESER